MANTLFGPGTRTERSPAEVKAAQDAARAADDRRAQAATAAGHGRRSIGGPQ